jgi:signal transduction histidine kinase
MTVALPSALWSAAPRRRTGLLVPAAAAAALVAALAVAVAVTVLVLGRLPDRRESDLVLPALLGGAAGALVVVPLQRRAVAAARRLVRGEHRPMDDVLRTLGDRASRGVPLEELLLQLAEQVRASLQLRHVEVWTGDGASLERLLSVPDRASPVPALRGAELAALSRTSVAGPAWLSTWLPALLVERGACDVRAVTARHAGTVLGLVVVERAAGEEHFGERDEQLLDEVGRRLGVLLHNRTLDAALTAVLDDLRRANDDLRASRARVVAAADSERRRIERDLHDGAQQHLVALAINLGLAADLCREDPSAAVELLESSRRDVRETVQQLRDLAHGIYPTLLTDAGLAPALQAAAVRCPSPVVLDLDGLAARPADPQTDAALYFCVLEALQNAGKHAPGAPVRVTGRRAEGRWVLEVRDDGPGLPAAGPDTSGGQGLQNLQDRMGAVGGTVVLSSRPGEGTAVTLSVPDPVPQGGA